MKRHYLTTAALAAAISSTTFAANPPSDDSVSQEMDAIRAKIQELEARQQLDQRKQAEAEQKFDARVTADELSREAVQRDQFISAEGFTAGYTNNRFVIQSADGKFLVRPWGYMQFRDVTLDRKNYQEAATKHPYDEVDNGFEMRRMKFGADGNMFSPDFNFFFSWGTQRSSGNSTVTVKTSGSKPVTSTGTISNSLGGVPQMDEAWVRYHIPYSPFFFKAGALKDPLYHEEIVSSRYQQGTERSISADIFANGDGYTEGATFSIDPATFYRLEAGVNHGLRSDDTNFLDYPNTNAFDYGVVGRFEYKAFGAWEDYGQIGAVGTSQPLLVLGAGADYSERGHDGQVVAAADIQYGNQNGLSLFGAFLDRYTTHNFGISSQGTIGASIGTPDPAVANKPTNEYAVVGEAGYIIARHWEPFGRYEFFHVQGTVAGSHNWIQAVTGGVNYYIVGHRLKLTGEVIYLPSGLPFDDSGNDVLASPNGKGELSFVAQLQLVL